MEFQLAVPRDAGDTILVKPGTDAEALVVQTDDLALKGSKGTVLTMPASAGNICTQLSGGTVIGICALGEVNPETFEVLEYLAGPRISGFTIRGFTDSGIIALGTDACAPPATTSSATAPGSCCWPTPPAR